MTRAKEMKRFSVSLPLEEYGQLQRIAKTHRPPLSLQYVVRYVLQQFLDQNKGRQLSLKLPETE